MRAFAKRLLPLTFLYTVFGLASAYAQSPAPAVAGAWHLVSISEMGADGKVIAHTNLSGQLLYSSDGHLSVQVSYPPEAAPADNEYVKGGYEASFGRYDVDPQAHTITHHVEGANVASLVGKSLPRRYELSGNRLIIRSTRSDEKWFVTWER
jgi:hypothetical protein